MMLRSLVVHDIPLEDIAAMERWYHRVHSPEIIRRYGPWLVRHESYLPVPMPAEAARFGLYNWRVTDGWWREMPKSGAQGALSFTDPPVQLRVATCFIPAQPTEDFLGAESVPDDHHVLRWLILFKYPPGVDKDLGERWFLDVHAPEMCRQPGLTRFFSYQVHHGDFGLPGTWPPKAKPPASLLHDWDRVIELWYDNARDWRRAAIDAPPRYTRPDWATRDSYPFVEPGRDFISSFILERPSDEFLRDSRIYRP